jgi:hypothetical protein
LHCLTGDSKYRREGAPSQWTKGQSCTNFLIGPLKWGCSVPNVTTTGGFSEYGVGYDVGPITSTGTAPIASLALDIDKIIAAGLSGLTGDTALNISLGFEGGYSFGFDAGVFGSFNLAAFDVMLDLLSSELSTSISLLQDFSLELEDLPLVMILEDGSRINGLSLGDDAIITAPVDFDADVDGDADGYITARRMISRLV